jgi:beta-glucosidase-like glycosyl hydrolase
MPNAARRSSTWAAALFVVVLLTLVSGGSPSGPSSSSATRAATSTAGTPSSSPVSSSAPSSTSSPSATSSPEEQLVTAALEGLDERARVAQLFLVGVHLDDLRSGDPLAEEGVGGLFMAGRSQAPAAELAETTARWQSLAPGPALWIAADQEGGAVQTFKGPGFDRLPPAAEQGTLPPAQLADMARTMGDQLAAAGVNLNLAPVVDVVPAGSEAGNAPIGAFDRQYGSTGPAVTAAAGAVVDGLAQAGVTATLKHFPGLGRVSTNTDTNAGVVDGSTTADDEQVAAFGALAASPAHPFVMVSSATYQWIDPSEQAAFSRVVLTDLLRGRLGFDGVVLTDDVGNAEAVQDVDAGERAVRFLGAGGTMVLTVDPAIVPDMIDAVLARSAADQQFAEQVDAAVTTALTAKARAGLLG